MNYHEKVKQACREDEDLSGNKFRYNREDDIVLLFARKGESMAYCYKKSELKLIIKRAYNINNILFSYIVLPHTGQKIINPQYILDSEKKAFDLVPGDVSNYRPDFGIPYEPVWRGDSVFENPPEEGIDIIEEKVEFKPSEEYLARQREMERIRIEREERERRAPREFEYYEDVKEIEIVDRDDVFSTWKGWHAREIEEIRNQMENAITNVEPLKYTGIENAEITITDDLDFRQVNRILNIDRRSPDTVVRVLENKNQGRVDWYIDGIQNREDDFPSAVEYKNGNITLSWYLDGRKGRENGKPSYMSSIDNTKIYFTDGLKNREDLPAYIDNNGIKWYNNDILRKEIFFGNYIVGREIVKGVIIYVDAYGSPIKKKFIRQE